MTAHSFMEVGRNLFLPCRESYIPELAGLFTETELQDQGSRYGYIAQVSQLRDRLTLHGFTRGHALRELETAVDAWGKDHRNPGFDDLQHPRPTANGLLRQLRHNVYTRVFYPRYPWPEPLLERLDPRVALRITLDVVDNEQLSVRYNLDDLLDAGLLQRGTPIADQARRYRAETVAREAPLIVLTEGSTDSLLLTEAVSVTHPHLIDFLRFMDFSSGVEGSAPNLAKLVRSFIGAGIANRVVAIADNDTAAYDALDKLKRESLPDSYRLIHYPNLPLLRKYPTLGPQLDNFVLMDVNGKAGSLEMYLGRELLTPKDELVPVQWTGYVEGQQRYQGAIARREKDRVQKAFRDKVKRARQDPNLRDAQDWTGVEAIVNTILEAFE